MAGHTTTGVYANKMPVALVTQSMLPLHGAIQLGLNRLLFELTDDFC